MTQTLPQIEREQEEIINMPERFYKKFQRDAKMLRMDLLKSEQRVRDEKQGWLLGSAKAWRQAIGVRREGERP